MVLMALDHVRDFFHIGAFTEDPLNVSTTTPQLFATRWVTHLCAPIFVFLSGVSIYLQGQRKTPKELGAFLLKRGAWLILAEWTIIAFGWTLNPYFNIFPFQVIWAIGISMVLMGIMLMIKTPYKLILGIGIVIVAGHNLLDIPESAPGFQAGFWWDLLHHGTFAPYEIAPNRFILLLYAFPVWTGVMLLGYSAGKLFTEPYTPATRRSILLKTGLGVLTFFFLLRLTNVYGDPVDWAFQKNWLYTFMSFINVDKYPASLLYLSITLGIGILFLALVEPLRNRFTATMGIFGRTALFYYILHIYLIRILSAVYFFSNGHTLEEAAELGKQLPFLFVAPGEGFPLWGVYATWMAVVLALYPCCKWYDNYKRRHPEKAWLSYL